MKKTLTIEEAEARHERIVEARAFAYGLLLGAVLFVYPELMIALRVEMTNSTVTVFIGETKLGPFLRQNYYIALIACGLEGISLPTLYSV